METKQELRDKIKELEQQIRDLKTVISDKNDIIKSNKSAYDDISEQLVYEQQLRQGIYENLRPVIMPVVMESLSNGTLNSEIKKLIASTVKENLSISTSSYSEMYGSYGETIHLGWGNTDISSETITMGHYDDD